VNYEGVQRMLWAVAAQYGFSETEMLRMPYTRLQFWYDGHVAMTKG